MRVRTWHAACVFLSLCAGSVAFAATSTSGTMARSKRTGVLVLDILGPLTPADLQAYTGTVAKTLTELGRFDPYTMAELRQMVSIEETRQLIGCSSNAACVAEIGNALGAGYAILGSVVPAEDHVVVELRFINNRTAHVEARVERKVAKEPGAMHEAFRGGTKRLVSDVLALRPGRVLLTANEEGARVKIDEKIVGTTPLPPLDVAGGYHTLELHKDGFVLFSRDLEVFEKTDNRVDVLMRPSPEMLRQRLQRAVILRALAWTSLGLAVAGAGTAIALGFASAPVAEAARLEVNAYNAQAIRSAALLALVEQRLATVAAWDAGILAAGVSAGAALLASVFLFVLPDPPSRWRTQLELQVGAGNASASIKW